MLCLKGKTSRNCGNFLSNTINAQRQWKRNSKILKPSEKKKKTKPVIPDIWMLKKISNKNEDGLATLNSLAVSLKKLKIYLPFDSAIMLLRYILPKVETCVCRNTS